MKLNEKIIKLRKDNNLSQEDFGNKLNISRQAVSKWENEETKPEIDKIRDISKIFNVSCDYLIFCTYKFIAFYKFYVIANSFSEENYVMFLQNYSKSIANGNNTQFLETTKVGNKKKVVAYFKRGIAFPEKEDSYENPLEIMYTDSDKKECYSLNYDEEQQKYIYTNSLDSSVNEEEKNQMLDVSENLEKGNLEIIDELISLFKKFNK